MRQLIVCAGALLLVPIMFEPAPRIAAASRAQSAAPQRIDLAERLAAGTLQPINREVTRLESPKGAVHVGEAPGNGVIWIAGNVSVCHSVHPPVEATVPVRRFCSAPGRLESS